MNKKILVILDFLLLVFIIIVGINFTNLKKDPEPVGKAKAPNEIMVSPTLRPLPELNLKNIFSGEATVSGSETITLIATGDVMLGRAINARSAEQADFNWPWEKTTATLKEADLTLINLESPASSDCPITYEGMTFCAESQSIDSLSGAGADVVNLANNHINDQGTKTAQDTEAFLKANGLLTSGIDKLAYKNVKGTTFAFLGYCDVCWSQSKTQRDKILQEVEEAGQTADMVVVSFHWGEEYTPMPSAYQIELAHLAVDNGAELVIGHHPHWIQPIEVYKGKLIAYSLGNFIFDQNWSQKTKEGLAIKTYFSGNKLFKVDLLPVLINDIGQPEFADGEEKERIISEIKEASFELAKN